MFLSSHHRSLAHSIPRSPEYNPRRFSTIDAEIQKIPHLLRLNLLTAKRRTTALLTGLGLWAEYALPLSELAPYRPAGAALGHALYVLTHLDLGIKA